ncbi:MAG: hypothetical protein JXN62_13365 [Bacteroidales bacterium]|nr:hypothetical protein [Bacteroidales bacterium]
MIIVQSTPTITQPYDFFDDKVQLENDHYQSIFGKTYKESGYFPWKRGIVKINYSGKVIRRLFYSGNSNNINKNSLGLSILSLQILDVQPNTNCEIELSKGNRFLFMWQHPNHLARIGFKYTVILGFLSLTLAVLPHIIKIFL